MDGLNASNQCCIVVFCHVCESCCELVYQILFSHIGAEHDSFDGHESFFYICKCSFVYDFINQWVDDTGGTGFDRRQQEIDDVASTACDFRHDGICFFVVAKTYAGPELVASGWKVELDVVECFFVSRVKPDALGAAIVAAFNFVATAGRVVGCPQESAIAGNCHIDLRSAIFGGYGQHTVIHGYLDEFEVSCEQLGIDLFEFCCSSDEGNLFGGGRSDLEGQCFSVEIRNWEITEAAGHGRRAVALFQLVDDFREDIHEECAVAGLDRQIGLPGSCEGVAVCAAQPYLGVCKCHFLFLSLVWLMTLVSIYRHVHMSRMVNSDICVVCADNRHAMLYMKGVNA